MKRHHFLAVVLVAVIACVGLYLKKYIPQVGHRTGNEIFSEKVTEDNKDIAAADKISMQPLTIDSDKQIKTIREKKWTSEQLQFNEQYFKWVIKDKGVQKLYSNSLKYFGNDTAGQGAARWVTLGVVLDSSKEYGQVLEKAQADANENAGQILAQINENLPEIRKDPFVYQMTMNLMHNLDLSNTERAQFYGGEFEAQVEQMTSDKPTDAFWISTLGLYLAQQSRVPASELRPFLDMAMNSPKMPEKIKLEMASMIGFYFPELKR